MMQIKYYCLVKFTINEAHRGLYMMNRNGAQYALALENIQSGSDDDLKKNPGLQKHYLRK